MTTKVNDMRGTRIVMGLIPALYDKVDISYPSPLTIVYTFSLDSVTIGVITVTSDDCGNTISVERTS